MTFGALGYRSGKPPQKYEYENIVKALKPVARHARKLGITLGLEPCNRYETHLLNTSTQALMLLEMIGEPNVTIHFDTYHMNIEEKGIGQALRATAGKSSYIHMSESDRGVPGTGTIDWPDIFRALADIGFRQAGGRELRHPAAGNRRGTLGLASGGQGPPRGVAKGVPFLKGLAKVHGLIA